MNDVKLSNGLLFSLPVVFDTDDEALVVGDKILLKQDDLPIATFTVESKYVRAPIRRTPSPPLPHRRRRRYCRLRLRLRLRFR